MIENINYDEIVLDAAYQPQVRTKRDTRSIMLDVIIALMPTLAFGIWQFGAQALVLVISSVASAVFFEWGYRKLMKKSNTIGDLSACVTGLLLALCTGTNAPWWLMIVGNFFAIVVVKQLYGGLGKNFLNPALAGRAFLLASYSGIMGTWTVPKALAAHVDAVTMATPLSYMYEGFALPEYYTAKSLFLGTIPGCIGEVSTLAILIGAAYLFIRKVITWHIPVSFLGTVALISILFGHEGYGNVDWTIYNLLAGGLVLNATFMANDYATSPVTHGGQIIYGVGCGILTMLIRYFGGFPEGVSYAILIMNLTAWAIDKAFRRRQFGVSKKDAKAAKAAAKAAKKAAKEA